MGPMLSFAINFSAAFRSLRERWQRSLLSALGITVGTSAIVLLVAIATGVESDIRGQVKDLGVNVLVVIPGRIEDGTFNPNLGGGSFLQEQDAKRLATVKGVISTAPWTFVGGGIRFGKKSTSPILVATTPNWFDMHPVQLAEGRILNAQDEQRDVCLIGSVAKDHLFGQKSALNQTVLINGRKTTVVGVTKDQRKEQSLFSMGGFQNLVYLSYHRLKTKQPDMQTDRIMVQIQPDVPPKPLIKSLEALLGQRLDRQQYQVLTQEDLLGLVFKLMGILTWLLTGLTSIALFVGGVGVMAIMLMAVGERAKEIGVRKTVGAKDRDIFVQFLSEATLLGVLGGLTGLALSYMVCLALYYNTPVKPMITSGIIFLGMGTSLLVACISGVIPALNASRKDPVASLRNE
jgi:putative ABC transport system permease protein